MSISITQSPRPIGFDENNESIGVIKKNLNSGREALKKLGINLDDEEKSLDEEK